MLPWRCAEEWASRGLPVNESKVLKVLKVLNFWGTGRRRIFAGVVPHPLTATQEVPGPSSRLQERGTDARA